MESLYVYTANRLEAPRIGDEGDGREWRRKSFWRAVVAEFLALVIFVFVGGASAMFTDGESPNDKIIKVSLAFGLCMMALIQLIGPVSGGHINPAVTVAMTVAKNCSIVRAVMYIIAQSVGALLGALILKGLTPDRFHDNLAVTSVHPDLTAVQGLCVEIILTFVLVSVILGTTNPDRLTFGNPALLIGLTVTLLHLAGMSLTGASMNPSRSLGSAVVSNNLDKHWVYWLGPIVGGVLAAVVHKTIVSPYM